MFSCWRVVMIACNVSWSVSSIYFFFQAEDGIRDLVRSRGLGDVYKRQDRYGDGRSVGRLEPRLDGRAQGFGERPQPCCICLLYTSDAADERSSVDLGGRRIFKKKKRCTRSMRAITTHTEVADLISNNETRRGKHYREEICYK